MKLGKTLSLGNLLRISHFHCIFIYGAVVMFKLVLFEIVKLLVKLYVDYIGVIIEA